MGLRCSFFVLKTFSLMFILKEQQLFKQAKNYLVIYIKPGKQMWVPEKIIE